MTAGVSLQKVDCLVCLVSRNVDLMEDKELTTDLMHDRQLESEAPYGSMR